MRTAIEEEPALVFGVLAPLRVPPLGLLGHEIEDADGEVRHAAKVGGGVARIGEGWVEADVFGDGEGGLRKSGGVGDEVARGGDVFGDGLLGEDVFAGGESGFDEGRLGDDGEGDDDGVDVGAGEEGGEGQGVFGVEGGRVRGREEGEDGLRGGEGA